MHTWVLLNGHAHGATESLEHGFDLVMRIVAAHIVDVQRHLGVIDEALEEFIEQVNIKIADRATFERDVIFNFQSNRLGKLHASRISDCSHSACHHSSREVPRETTLFAYDNLKEFVFLRSLKLNDWQHRTGH